MIATLLIPPGSGVDPSGATEPDTLDDKQQNNQTAYDAQKG